MQEQANRLAELEKNQRQLQNKSNLSNYQNKHPKNSTNNNPKNSNKKSTTTTRKWGQSNAKTTFIPASQRNISTDKFNAERKARLEKRQNELLQEQERQMINTEKKRMMADAKQRKIKERREKVRAEEERNYQEAVAKNMAPPITQSVSPRNYRHYHEERQPIHEIPKSSVEQSNQYNLKFSNQSPIKSPSMTQTNKEAYFDTKVSNVEITQRPITGNNPNHPNNELVAKNQQRMQKLKNNEQQVDPNIFSMMRQGMRQRADRNLRLQEDL